ncbi:MAG: FG-GAP repeat protein, partial [Patescibacteria group bacterium]|nr:FG-GAP repeat protein [Patescibacteria group bacterium]
MFRKKFLYVFVVVSMILNLVPGLTSASFVEQDQIIASNGVTNDCFGYSIGSDGNWAVVSSVCKDSQKGAVYVYHWDGNSWTESQILTASDGVAGDYFGYSVAISGDYIIVGSPFGNDTVVSNSGAAYVYHWNGTVWTSEQKITASDLGNEDNFGTKVSISGDKVAISSPRNDNGADAMFGFPLPDIGAVYSYRFDNGTWTHEQKITSSDQNSGDYERFGSGLSMSGDYLIVGSSNTAYSYHWNGTIWTNEQILTPVLTSAYDGFGREISIDGDYIIVGASHDDTVTTDAGAVYMYYLNAGVWGDPQKITPFDGVIRDNFGWQVYLKGTTMGVSLYAEDEWSGQSSIVGETYIYNYNISNSSWEYQYKLTASDGTIGDQFGSGMTINGSNFLISASKGNNVNGTAAGTLYVFSSNTAPTLSNLTATPATDGSGEVSIVSTVNDADNNELSIAYYYSPDTCSASLPSTTSTISSVTSENGTAVTSTGSYQVTTVTTTPGANIVTSTWGSQTDLSDANGVYCVYAVAYDGTVTSTMATTTVTLDNVISSAPSISTFTSASTTLEFVWEAVVDTSFYTVSSTAGTSVTTTNTRYTYGSSSALTPNTEYSWQVKATDSYSNASSYSTVTSTYTNPALPTSVTATANGQTAVTVSWNANGNPVGTTYVIGNNKSDVYNKTTTSTT